MKIVLCVEDELHILENNRQVLEDAGYTVLTAENLAQAREHLGFPKRPSEADVLGERSDRPQDAAFDAKFAAKQVTRASRD